MPDTPPVTKKDIDTAMAELIFQKSQIALLENKPFDPKAAQDAALKRIDRLTSNALAQHMKDSAEQHVSKAATDAVQFQLGMIPLNQLGQVIDDLHKTRDAVFNGIGAEERLAVIKDEIARTERQGEFLKITEQSKQLIEGDQESIKKEEKIYTELASIIREDAKLAEKEGRIDAKEKAEKEISQDQEMLELDKKALKEEIQKADMLKAMKVSGPDELEDAKRTSNELSLLSPRKEYGWFQKELEEHKATLALNTNLSLLGELKSALHIKESNDGSSLFHLMADVNKTIAKQPEVMAERIKVNNGEIKDGMPDDEAYYATQNRDYYNDHPVYAAALKKELERQIEEAKEKEKAKQAQSEMHPEKFPANSVPKENSWLPFPLQFLPIPKKGNSGPSQP